jgi:phosphate transport system substrate-binding protein
MANLPGIPSDKIKLDGETIAGIFLGNIKRWDAAAIKALNPDLKLPPLAVMPIFRNQGSGTSFAFTSYLSKVSPQFKTTIGPTSNLNLATGQGGKTSTDMAKLVRDTAGAIGYFDYSFTAELSMPTIQLKNQWGTYVAASTQSLQLAMRAADWEKLMIDQEPTFEMDLTDAGCPGCWPIASPTYVLVPLKGKNANSVRVLEFFEQSIKQGDELATKEGYVPLPSRAKNLIGIAMFRWYAALEKAGAGKPRQRTESIPSGTALAAR